MPRKRSNDCKSWDPAPSCDGTTLRTSSARGRANASARGSRIASSSRRLPLLPRAIFKSRRGETVATTSRPLFAHPHAEIPPRTTVTFPTTTTAPLRRPMPKAAWTLRVSCACPSRRRDDRKPDVRRPAPRPQRGLRLDPVSNVVSRIVAARAEMAGLLVQVGAISAPSERNEDYGVPTHSPAPESGSGVMHVLWGPHASFEHGNPASTASTHRLP